jgi:hypothetical protein
MPAPLSVGNKAVEAYVKAWSYTSTPLYAFVKYCFIKHRDYFFIRMVGSIVRTQNLKLCSSLPILKLFIDTISTAEARN